MDEEKRIKEIIDSLASLCGCKKESLYEYFLKNTVKKENDISKWLENRINYCCEHINLFSKESNIEKRFYEGKLSAYLDIFEKYMEMKENEKS